MRKINCLSWLPLFLTLTAFIALSSGFVAEYFFKLRPCSLCLFQQYTFLAILIIGCLSIFLPFLKEFPRKASFLLALLYILNASIALYQVAVEHQWVDPPSQCQHKKLSGTSIEEMREQLLNTETIRCDQVQWSLFGISMAGYSALYCLGLGIFTFHFLRRHKKKKEPQ